MASGVIFYHGVCALIISIFNICLNLLTINAFIEIKMLSLNPSNQLILALSFADLMYGVAVIILNAISYTFSPTYFYGEYGCMLLVACSNFYVVGNLILVAISVDRVLLVSLNYSTYVKIQTKTRVRIAIAICFITGLISALFEVSLWVYARRTNPVAANFDFHKFCFSPARFTRWFGLVYSIGLFCFPVLLIGVLSAVFFCLLRVRIRKATKIGSMAGSGAQRTEEQQISSLSANQVELNREPQQQNRESKHEGNESRSRYIKAVVTLAALVSAMGICILPYCVYIIVGIFCSECTSTVKLYVVLTIVQMNPLLDPIFYSATQRNIRDYYKSKVNKLWSRITAR